MAGITITGTIDVDGVPRRFTIGDDYRWTAVQSIAPYVRAMVEGLAGDELLTPADERQPFPWEL